MPHGVDNRFDSFYTSSTAQVVTATTGSISALSSFLIIVFIMRSGGKLSSPYHRIMFFMSFWDIVLSITLAVNIIPLPADAHEMYNFDGTSYGSIGTCALQGFLYVVCSGFCITSNSALCIFYMCTICYGMKDKTVKRVLLPVLLVLCTISTLGFPVYMLSKDLFNPSPFDPFCSWGPMPYDCDQKMEKIDDDNYVDESLTESEEPGDDTNVCVRGDPSSFKLSQILITLNLASNFCILIVCMTMIISKVCRNDDVLPPNSSAMDQSLQSGSETNRPFDGRHSASVNPQEEELQMEHIKLLKVRKRVVRQAVMYISAFILTWIFVMIPLALSLFKRFDTIKMNSSIALLRLIFQPLQGFFNAIIFFYHKGCNVKRSDTGEGWGNALWTVFASPSTVPEIIISEVDMVIMDSFMNDREETMIAMQRLGAPRDFSQSVDVLDGVSNANGSSSMSSGPRMNSSLSSSSVFSRDRQTNGNWSLDGETGLSLDASSHILSLGVVKEEGNQET